MPGVAQPRRHAEVLTPGDLERDWGLSGGHIFITASWRSTSSHDAATAGLESVPDADRGLWLCGAGTHPGLGLTGGSGANAAREPRRSSVPNQKFASAPRH